MITSANLHINDKSPRLLLQTSEFVCLLPHPHLQGYIANYNVTFPTKDLMPDGFTEMPSGGATLAIENNSKNLFTRLTGPASKPSVIGIQTNQLEMLVTIEFKPAGLYALTGISQSELLDTALSFDTISPQLSRSVSEAVEKAASIQALADHLDMLFLANLYATYHPELRSALRYIAASAGNINVKTLSADAHYSERQLNRIFQQQVGVSAKSFSRLVRINNSFGLLKCPNHSVTLISDVMGYHDRSHFIRDFKSVCGLTPQAFRQNMSDFYTNPIRF